jgi:hypothetical protein
MRAALATALLLASGPAHAGSSIVASRRAGEIRIDGRLDEPAWQQASPFTDFWQRGPLEGQPPTYTSEVRILYDDDAIYVGVRANDSQPALLTRALTRYDEWTSADWIVVGFDTYRDRRTAFQFAVNAGGTKFDEILYDDTRNDSSWSGVWEGRQAIDAAGWSVEMRIPLSQLRYPDVEEQVWGFQVTRIVHRLQEATVFSRWPETANQRVSLFGELRGIRGLAQRRRLELMPYALGGLSREAGDTDAIGRIGVDAKYGLAGNVTLTATVNPDFGQVEADPSEFNLTATETFFPEKRPFFLEGGDLFRRRLKPFVYDEGGPEEVFYSRRIGAIPYRASDDGLPEATTIYGAAKLTGKTSRGLSIGALSAVTAEEEETDIVTEPLAHYGVARVKQDIGDTSVGVIATAVNRRVDGTPAEDDLHDQGIVGGADLVSRFGGDEWIADVVVLASRVSGTAAAIDRTQRASPRYYQRPDAGYLDYDPTRTSLSGWAAAGQVGRYGSEHVRGAVGVDARSPGLDLNDAGFQQYADKIEPWAWTQWFDARAGETLQNYRFNASVWGTSSFETRLLDTWANVNAHALWRNQWSAGTGLSRKWARWDVRALRGGPTLRDESRWLPWAYLQSDSRRRVSASLNLSTWWQPTGDSWALTWDGAVLTRIGDHVELWLGTLGERRIDDGQYVGTFAAPDPRYVLARIDQTTVAATVRARVGFTPELSLDLYAQPFVSRGAYGNYREVTAPDAGDYAGRFSPVEPGDFPDFAPADFRFRELRSNLVVRWELRPGSAALLVWSHGRTSEVDRDDFAGDLGALTGDGEDVVLAKISYWFTP